MVRKLAFLVALIAVVGATAFWYVTSPASVPAHALAPYAPNLATGKTVFHAGGCASCHATPDQEDGTRLGGGRALKSPFGTFYAPNISPHRDDGIGNWSEAEFVTALWTGTAPDGRHYFPAFPFTSYQRMTLDDARDLFAYIKTLPAVPGRARDHDLRLPFGMRRLVAVWKLLFLDGEPHRPDPSKSSQWNRGAYLVNALAHCAECHSPRNALGAIRSDHRFAGGPSPTGEGWVPNITQRGTGDYSEKQLAALLETGEIADGTDFVGGDMAVVVRNTAQLAPEDRAAIATYIKALPPVEGPPKPRK